MDQHWHAYAFTGARRPSDAEARDPASATPPHQVAHFFRKPRSMLAGTYRDPERAHAWLAAQLAADPPGRGGVPVAAELRVAREALRRGQDAYVGFYTAAGGYLVRALLVCPRRGERCPDPPRGTSHPSG